MPEGGSTPTPTPKCPFFLWAGALNALNLVLHFGAGGWGLNPPQAYLDTHISFRTHRLTRTHRQEYTHKDTPPCLHAKLSGWQRIKNPHYLWFRKASLGIIQKVNQLQVCWHELLFKIYAFEDLCRRISGWEFKGIPHFKTESHTL